MVNLELSLPGWIRMVQQTRMASDKVLQSLTGLFAGRSLSSVRSMALSRSVHASVTLVLTLFLSMVCSVSLKGYISLRYEYLQIKFHFDFLQ